ncbi:MAG: dienelactone hydrolase family protein [Pseudomonadota bacterium]
MKELEFFEIEPLSKEKPKKLMVFLHGYGASGEDLIDLAREFKHSVPHAHFISPNAPFSLSHPFMSGYQWFSLENYDPKIIYPQILEANRILDIFIDSQLERFGLSHEDLIIVGFSQGAMMAMYNSLRRKEPNAGIIAYSGKLILPNWLGESVNSKPKICLIHGKNDEVLPFENFLEAKKLLEQEQVPFEHHALEGLGHGIDHHGIRIGRDFLLNI